MRSLITVNAFKALCGLSKGNVPWMEKPVAKRRETTCHAEAEERVLTRIGGISAYWQVGQEVGQVGAGGETGFNIADLFAEVGKDL